MATEKYNTIRNETLYQGIPLEAIYFNQKCIDIAKKNNHTEALVQSLIYMGNCFDKANLPSDMNISKNLKEEAKNIYKEKLDGKNYALESSIYKALKGLYNELASQQKQSKNYKKAIELLNKLLEVLTECIANTKTIFSFNYQNSAIKMYKSKANEHIKDSLLLSASISAGEFLSFISNQ